MKKALLKAAVLMVLVIPGLLMRYSFMTTKDKYYWAAAGTSNSLVIGTSTEREGINPSVVAEVLDLEQVPLNVAMTASDSPFGQPYLDFIRKKLAYPHDPGLYIVGVSPRALIHFDREVKPREEDNFILQIGDLNQHPNWEYFLKFHLESSQWEDLWSRYILQQVPGRRTVFHKNGWSQVVRAKPPILLKRVDYVDGEHIQSERLQALSDIVSFLSEQGQVIMVRSPKASIVSEMLQPVFPDFDQKIDSLAQLHNVPYLNYMSQGDDFTYHDRSGVHLESESADEFSKVLAEDIKEILGEVR